MDREDKTPCDECGVLEHERSMNFVGDKFVCVHCENDLESEEED
jgi:formylmethanofuran dehydrogenase subunit E